MIEMVVRDPTQDANKQWVVALKEREGERTLQIVIGPAEAHAIAWQLKGVKMQRPMTHDLMRSLLEEVGVRVTRVAVCDLRDNVYYAIVTVVTNGKEHQVDARPSDAIALALRAEAPIYVSDEVVEQAGVVEQPQAEPETEEEAKEAPDDD